MDQNEACAAYFAGRPAYRRILEALRDKYRGLGRVGGRIILRDAGEEELEAARALFGRPFGLPLRIGLEEFERALQETPYRGATLPGLLAAYFGGPVATKREERAERDERFQRAVGRAGRALASCRAGEESAAGRWLAALSEGRAGGAALVRQSLSCGEDAGEALERTVLCASHAGPPIRRAVLSAGVTGDPHALDEGTTAGKLLLHLLAFGEGAAFPQNAEQRDALYYSGGILCDSISSTVTQMGLLLLTKEGEHPAFAAMRLRREACTLSLCNLSLLEGASSPSGRVYIVENEMVFSHLCDRAKDFHSPLICTSGQVAVASLRLLDLLAASGTRMFYAGDFDGEGLSIAARLMERCAGLMDPWRLSPGDYDACVSGVELKKPSLALLRGLEGGVLGDTAAAVLRRGRAGYQELLLPGLLRDLTETP